MNEENEALVRKVVETTMETERQMRRKQMLYNTRTLMEQYRNMKQHVENAISEEREMQERYNVFRGGNAHLKSVRRSKMKTAMMLANIDRAMEELRKEAEKEGTAYKYEAFQMHYIEGKPYEDIAEKQNCGKNTPSRWSNELIKRMSVKLFGVDGVEKY